MCPGHQTFNSIEHGVISQEGMSNSEMTKQFILHLNSSGLNENTFDSSAVTNSALGEKKIVLGNKY